MKREGDARGPQTGSVSTRQPSISISTVEWPSQVARKPLPTGRVQTSRGFRDGSGACGTRRSPPQMNSLIDGMATVGSPRETGLELRKRAPSQRGEAAIRSRREFFIVDFLRATTRASTPLTTIYFVRRLRSLSKEVGCTPFFGRIRPTRWCNSICIRLCREFVSMNMKKNAKQGWNCRSQAC